MDRGLGLEKQLLKWAWDVDSQNAFLNEVWLILSRCAPPLANGTISVKTYWQSDLAETRGPLLPFRGLFLA